MRPAWSWAFQPGALRQVDAGIPHRITSEWAWGGSTGEGVKVAVLDSGIDASHPWVGTVEGAVAIEHDPEAPGGVRFEEGPHDDVFGHGTACAGIIRTMAPECEIYSVRVLGKKLSGKGFVFAAGLRWAMQHDMRVVNLSLSTSKRDYYSVFHRLADEAAFRRIMLVCAINNMPGPSFPAEYSSVFSVASHGDVEDRFAFDYNPSPPAEWGAPGIDIEVPWLDGKTIVATGNSFAAPHITGVLTLILAKHPDLTPFQAKTVLMALARNVRAADLESPAP
jgi:subtilisin family serine protease